MPTREELEQAAATWIAQRDGGAWTEADAAALQEWLGRSAGHRAAYYRLNAAWTEAGRVRALGATTLAASAATPASTSLPAPMQSEPPESAVRRSRAASADSPPSRTRRRSAAFAIAATVLIVLAGTLFIVKDEIFRTTDHFTTVVGGLQAVPMSDGSRVTLNTNSEVSISLGSRERVVEIEHGEAFFQVAHDPQRPFVVKVAGRRVVAVGTQFSVRREGTEVRVVVSEGTVRYESRSGDTMSSSGEGAVLLTAGSVAQTRGNTVRVERLPVTEAERTLTWRNGLLTFRETPLSEAVAEFNRYNTRKIVIEDPAIASVEVGGVFRSNNVDPFVRLLERGFGIEAAVQADKIVLKASASRR